MTVRCEVTDLVAEITIDRPHRRNAVDHATLLALDAALLDVGANGVRVVLLTGSPPAFCAGADLTGVDHDDFASALSQVLVRLTSLDAVTIAAVDGPALGAGTQLAIACDLRVASPTSVFGIPAARLGLAVDPWTVGRLSHEFGPPTARAMLLAATNRTADYLHDLGGVHRLGDLDTARSWAREISELAPLSIIAHKRALEARGSGIHDDPAVEAARAAAWASQDAVEGRQAFLDKRPAVFRGL
jgi:enoyl-CoA hydratase